jgi:hypothetical protein
MSNESSAVQHGRTDASECARKQWEQPALRVLGARFARNNNNVCADITLPNRDNGTQCTHS